MYPTRETIADHLRETHALSQSEVEERATIIAEDVCRLGMEDFTLCPLELITKPGTNEKYMLVEYTFGRVPFSIENATNSSSLRPTVREMGGSGLDRGELLYLSRVFKIARTLIPQHWFHDKRLLAEVREPGRHLSTLNEIWWLARWNNFLETGLERECHHNPRSTKCVDWRFPLSVWGRQWFINLEVKCRVGSISDRSYNRRHLFYRHLRRDGSEDFDDPRLKFRASSDNEINILAVTWYDQISTELESEIKRFLAESDSVDVVAMWAPGDRQRGGWIRFFRRGTETTGKRQVFHAALKDPDEEDQTRIMRNICPVPLPVALSGQSDPSS